jgi:hypothetical protein
MDAWFSQTSGISDHILVHRLLRLEEVAMAASKQLLRAVEQHFKPTAYLAAIWYTAQNLW